IERRRRDRLATRGGYSQNWPDVVRHENSAIRAPGSSGGLRAWNIAERGDRTSRGVDLFQLVVGDEREKSAIRRPEWRTRAVRTSQRLHRKRAERAQP